MSFCCPDRSGTRHTLGHMDDIKGQSEQSEKDEPVAIPLDPEEALRALLKVDPESEPAQGDGGRSPS